MSAMDSDHGNKQVRSCGSDASACCAGRMLRQGETLEEYAEEFWSGGEPNEVKMEIPQDLKDYLDTVPLVTEEQAKQLADHVRAVDVERMNVCRECRTDPEWWKTGEEPNTVDSYVCPKCGKRHSVFWHNNKDMPPACGSALSGYSETPNHPKP